MQYDYEMGRKLKHKQYFEIIRDQRRYFILFFVLAFILWLTVFITMLAVIIYDKSVVTAWILSTVGLIGLIAHRFFGIIFRALFVYFTYKICVTCQIKAFGSVTSVLLAWFFPLIPFIYLMIKIQQTLKLEVS